MSEEYEYEYESEGHEDEDVQEESSESMEIPLVPSAEELKKDIDRSGVVYMGTVPKGMLPEDLRRLLEPYGVVKRIFMNPDKKRTYRGKAIFTEAWIEFEDGELAESLVEAINLKPMTQRRKSPYHSYTWLLKFLPNYKWSDLSQARSFKSRTRAEKLRERIIESRNEANYYRGISSKKVAE